MSELENPAEGQEVDLWELKQLVKLGIYPNERAAMRGALRALFQLSPQMKLRMVVSAYEAGDISLSKAAALLGVSLEELCDIVGFLLPLPSAACVST